jgi:DNA-binding ferritin-like protein
MSRTTRKKNTSKTHIAEIFLGMLNTVKLYHWKTTSFAEHKATDELYQSLNENIDKFMEIALGKNESRLKHISMTINAFNDKNKTAFKSRVYEYRKLLIRLSDTLDKRVDTDLLNIRDEILGDINKFLYLLTFHK